VSVRRSPDGLLQQLSSTWAGGLPGPAAAALAAAAGLAAGGVLGEGQLQEMMTQMQGLVGGDSR
jgi:outer membrane lipoprotein SlyB